jgi:hypothetical protein
MNRGGRDFEYPEVVYVRWVMLFAVYKPQILRRDTNRFGSRYNAIAIKGKTKWRRKSPALKARIYLITE